MCDYCYDESASIANESDFRAGDIAEIDRFLCRTILREFKLQDAKDCLNDARLAEPILDDYIKRGVLRRDERYFCPSHTHTVLKFQKSQLSNYTGYCHKCDERYALGGLDSETIFVRLKAPNRALHSQENPAGQALRESDRPTLRQRAISFVAEHIVFAVRGIIILVCAGLILQLFTLSPITDSNPTANVGETPSPTPKSTTTPMTTNRPAVSTIIARTPSA